MTRPLPPSALHLWRLPLDLAAEAQAVAAAGLTPEERARASRFHFAADGRHFVAARGQLRQVLAAYTGRPPARVELAAGEHGKPHLTPPPAPLHFNLAHSGVWALVAMARAWPVGVDIEAIRPMTDRAAIARRFFAPGEAQRLEALPPADQEAAFFRCWTRKEAYIKALGGGLSLPLDEFEVTLEPGAPRLLWAKGDPGEAEAWSLAEPVLPAGYVGAVAVRARDVMVVDCGVWVAA